jgi:hypothetical protein
MPDPTPQQIQDWKKYRTTWINQVRPAIKKMILVGEFAEEFQEWAEVHGVLFVDIFNNADDTRISQLVDTYNRVDRAISKVDLGVYALRYSPEGRIDIVAPLGMDPEEFQADMLSGFGAVIPVIIVGLIVAGTIVASIWAVSEYHKSTAKIESSNSIKKIVAGAKEIAAMSPEMQKALASLIEKNKEKLKEAGLLDQLLGGGAGKMIAIAIAAGVLLFAYSKRSK